MLAAIGFGQNQVITQQERDYERTNQAALSQTKSEIPPVPAVELRARGGLPNIFAKLERGEAVTVAYFGGSITAHPGWRVQSFDWLQKQYPKARLTMLNASLGGTGSLVGAFRADTELIAFKPDLVFIEFALNDGGDAGSQPDEVLRALEGIVRKIWRSKPDADICIVYTVGASDVATLASGVFQRGATVHEIIANKYNIPSVHFGVEVAKLETEGKLVPKAPATPNGRTADGKLIFTDDGSHPTIPWGHAIYAEVVERSLLKMRGIGHARPHVLPKPLMEDNWELAKTIPLAGNALVQGTWDKLTAANGPSCMRYGTKFYEWFPYLYHTTTPGSSVTVRFRGTHVGIKGIPGPDAGVVGIQVDGRPVTKDCLFSVYSTRHAYGGRPLPAMKDGVHTVTWTLLPDKPDKGKILASYYRKGNDQDFIQHPEKYAENAFYAGQIILVGDILSPEQEVDSVRSTK